MNNKLPSLLLCTSFFLSSATLAAHIDTTPSDHVDLERYVGQWHETARFENIFQRGLHAVTALYERMADGSLRVTNAGTAADGKRHEAIGKAVHRKDSPSGELEVSFVPPYTSFFSDYRILYVTPDYSGALVSDAEGNHLWLLERSEESNPEVQQQLLNEAQARGFDITELTYSDEESANARAEDADAFWNDDDEEDEDTESESAVVPE